MPFSLAVVHMVILLSPRFLFLFIRYGTLSMKVQLSPALPTRSFAPEGTWVKLQPHLLRQMMINNDALVRVFMGLTGSAPNNNDTYRMGDLFFGGRRGNAGHNRPTPIKLCATNQ